LLCGLKNIYIHALTYTYIYIHKYQRMNMYIYEMCYAGSRAVPAQHLVEILKSQLYDYLVSQM